MRAANLLALMLLASLLPIGPRDVAASAPQQSSLPKIGPAPDFALTSQDGTEVALADLRGKVAAVTFIFTRCTATCPVLTPMMSLVQERLGGDFGSKIAFASITVDPEQATPEMLQLYAQNYAAADRCSSFLTGRQPL